MEGAFGYKASKYTYGRFDFDLFCCGGGLLAVTIEYLGRSLNQRSYAAGEAFGKRKREIMGKAAYNNSLASGRTMIQFRESAQSVFREHAADAARFAYNLMETNDETVSKPLDYCVARMVELIMDHVIEGSTRLGLHGADTAPHSAKARELLNEQKSRFMDDFVHGMIGNERLKNDPVVSIVNSQTNSPGAIQQVGVGKFSQTAFNENHTPLIAAIDAALASEEYKNLEPGLKDGFKDIADIVREEASKSQPDVGRLQRWSTRLLEFSKTAGMKIAENALIQVLVKIFF